MKEKQIILITVTVLFIIATGILYCFSGTKNVSENVIVTDDNIAASDDGKSDRPQEEAAICVYICGEIKHPGVYQVKETDRVTDLIKQAGGFTKKAEAESVNQAQHLMDGQQIYIPSKEEAKQGAAAQGNAKLININTASAEELMTLPGIGESKANSIIQYREKNQGFRAVDEIKKIEGIKDGVFQKIQEYITIY